MKNIVVILDVTNDCNFRCEYCYLSAGERKEVMDFETAVYAADIIYKKYKCVVNIVFHGGEPLLYFDLIKRVVFELSQKDYAGDLKFFIQTNGYFLDSKIVNFFKKYNFNVGVSIDGYYDRSNCARRDSGGRFTTEKVKENIRLLISKNLSVSILAVINRYNYDTITDEMDSFVKIGIKSFAMNPFIPAGRGRQSRIGVSAEQMFVAYKSVVNKIIECQEKGNTIFEKNIFFMAKKIVSGNAGYMCMTTPCGAGLAQYTIAPNGDVYPCADFSGIEEFNLGNIKDDIFNNMLKNKKWKEIRMNRLENFEKCRNCTIANNCTAGCCVRAYFNNGSLDSIDPICELNQLLIPYIMKPNVLSKLNIEGNS